MNREAWLTALVGLFRAHFETTGFPLPTTIHVSVGWPARRALSRTNRRTGECWEPNVSEDGGVHIFVSPVLDNAYDVAAILLHELVHAAVGPGHHHNKVFRAAARKVGMVGKPTSSNTGPELTQLVKSLLKTLPPWPHAALMLLEGGPARGKGPGSRQVRVTCEHGYTVRTTRKWLAEGNPLCPQGHPMKETP